METLPTGNTRAQEPPQPGDITALMGLFGEMGRTKLSMQTLLSRPQWRSRLEERLQAAGLQALSDTRQLDGQFSHWLMIFHRLGQSLLGQGLGDSEGDTGAGLPMRAVADTMGVPLSSATRFVGVLAQRDLLSRHNDQEDRRVVVVTLTPLGRRVHEVVDAELRVLVGELLAYLTPEERGQLLHLGRRLHAFWQAQMPCVAGSQANLEATCEAV